MPKYEEKTEAPKAVKSKKFDTAGGATNTLWSTDKGTQSIKKAVTPSAETQSRNR